jgi:hypothetical protein
MLDYIKELDGMGAGITLRVVIISSGRVETVGGP